MKDNKFVKTIVSTAKEPVRLINLSDGLFATVLTLLVLDLRIPEAVNTVGGGIHPYINWVGPHLFSYLMTFFVAGNYWLAHHRVFDHVVDYDRSLLGYNLLFLLFVGLLPFSTAAISLGSPSTGSYAFYWAIYALNITLAGVMLSLTWLYAMSHGFVDDETTRKEHQYILVRQLVNPAVFLISIGLEFLYPEFFLGPWILLVLFPAQMLVDRIFAHTEPDHSSIQKTWLRGLWRAGVTLLWLLIFGLAVWVMTL